MNLAAMLAQGKLRRIKTERSTALSLTQLTVVARKVCLELLRECRGTRRSYVPRIVVSFGHHRMRAARERLGVNFETPRGAGVSGLQSSVDIDLYFRYATLRVRRRRRYGQRFTSGCYACDLDTRRRRVGRYYGN